MYMSELTKQVEKGYSHPLVDTCYGTLCGIKKEDGYIFRGISYAHAERFQMPQPPKAWEGIKDAIVYGPSCPEITTPISPIQFLSGHYYCPQDENCQYLNIWTPEMDQKKRPVIFWLHGGGWFSGSAVEQYAYDGENLSQYGDAVVVSVNHRLNVLGYLDLSCYGSKYKDSKHVGLADLVSALEWVKRNIARFGGDPSNVTIMGQSGGGSKVVALMQTPAADDLYHKAILESGGERCAEAPAGSDMSSLRHEVTEGIVDYLGLSSENISLIDTVPYLELAAAAEYTLKEMEKKYGKGSWSRWEPAPDESYFLGYAHKTGFREETLCVPMLTCTVFGEQNCNLYVNKSNLSEDEINKRYQERFGDKLSAVKEAFENSYPDKKQVDVLFMDSLTRGNILKLTKMRAQQGGIIWNAIFTWESPIKGGITAWHCSELPFVFHNSEYIESAFVPGETEELQDKMAGAWVAFARFGQPSIEGFSDWPPATVQSVPTMIFDKDIRLSIDHDKALLGLLAE